MSRSPTTAALSPPQGDAAGPAPPTPAHGQSSPVHYQPLGRSKEPAVVAAERYVNLLMHYEGLEEIMNALDPSITFISPMVYYRGRPVVKSWIQFEVRTLIPFHPYMKLKDIKSEDEMKSAVVRWSVGGLHFVDKIQLSQLLQYQTITRTMRREYKTLDDKLVAEEFLRLLTGPHFSGHCEPKQRQIDNAALVLPTLDYSHLKLRDFKQLLSVAPSASSSSRPISDMNVVYHFMSDALVKAQLESEKRKEADEEKTRKTNFAKNHGEQFVIRATNREGEKKVLIIDKSDFFRSNQGSKVEQLQDDEVTGIATKHDRPRFLCSCVRLRNNFFGARDDEQFDADGKPVVLTEEEKLQLTKGNSAAAAAARLAGTSGSGSLMPNSSSRDSKSMTAQETAAAAAAAAELGTVLKLLTLNSFYFITNVDLSSNKLTVIPDLSELPLVGLSLHDNRLSSWEDVELKLKPLRLLQNLTLFANPIQKEAVSVKEYKYGILSIFFSTNGNPMKDPPLGPLSSGPLKAGGKIGAPPKSLNITASYYGGGGAATTSSSAIAAANNTTVSATGEQAGASRGGGGSSLPPLVRGGGAALNNSSATALSAAHRTSFTRPLTAGTATSHPTAGPQHAVITLRTLDHSVISPKEVDIVKTFLKTFNTKREQHIKDERNPRRRKNNEQDDLFGSPYSSGSLAGSGKGAVAGLRGGAVAARH